MIIALLALVACGPSVTPEQARQAVEARFAEQNPSGRTGLELKGKGVWYEAPWFVDGCLESHDLAFNDDPSSRPRSGVKRISPTYQNQRWLTASTPKGYCLYMGSDPSISTDPESVVWVGDRYKVQATINMGAPSPWFQCLAPGVQAPMVEVLVDEEGKTSIEQDLSLKQGACPSPLPGGEERVARSRPTVAPPAPPTVDDARSLARRLDDALYEQDWQLVQDLTVCYNLFEKDKVGTCAVSEYLGLGPSFHGESRPQDGTPWLEYTIKVPADIQRIKRDREDPTMFHAVMKHKRTGRDKSFTLQWDGGKWKLVAVVGLKGEGLTSARYLYDLHRPERHDIFERRMQGEDIDEQGNPPADAELE